ncbi:hypothetical protein K474DRAFT_1387946 [Panus rudis PR-1116 ss-1]|nr:hypothetical protein K474DRAFT_1387946 [Panus rudis PR-1116 ss-1]
MSTEYIVVFKDSASPEAIEKYAQEVGSAGGNVTARYDSALKGFAATIPDSYLQSLQAQSQLADSPIQLIEPDGIVTTQ